MLQALLSSCLRSQKEFMNLVVFHASSYIMKLQRILQGMIFFMRSFFHFFKTLDLHLPFFLRHLSLSFGFCRFWVACLCYQSDSS